MTNFANLNSKIYIFLFGTAVPIFTMSHMVNLDFWIIDDHNIFGMIGPDGVLTFKELTAYLISHSDYAFGETPRFRPWLFPAIGIEVFMFGDNIWGYYYNRLFVFVAFCICSALFIFRMSGHSLLFTLFYILFYCASNLWTDIFLRIITSEFYCIFFLLFALAIFETFQSLSPEYKKRLFFFFLMAFSFLIFVSTGMKENLLAIAIFPIVTIFTFRDHFAELGRIKKVILVIFCCLPFGLWFAQSMIIFSFFVNSDTTSGFFGTHDFLISFIKSLWVLFIEYCVVVFYLFVLFVRKSEKKYFATRVKKSQEFHFYTSALVLLLLYQIIFYSGVLRPESRYWFISFLGLACFYAHCFKLVMPFWLKCDWKLLKTFGFLVFITFSLIFTLQVLHNRSVVYAAVQRNGAFAEFLKDVGERLSLGKYEAVVVDSNNVWDYEGISSLFKYLRYRVLYSGPIFLKFEWSTVNDLSGTGANYGAGDILAQRLVAVANGELGRSILGWSPSHSDWGFAHPDDFDELARCLSLRFDEKYLETTCNDSIVVPYR